MKYFKKYYESLSPFGVNHMNNGSVPPNDNEISVSGYNREKNKQRNEKNKLVAILKKLQGGRSHFLPGHNLKNLDIYYLNILKKEKTAQQTTNIVVEYKLIEDNEKENVSYIASFKNFGTSNVLFKTNYTNRNEIYLIRIKNIIRNTLEYWFKPNKGIYILLDDFDVRDEVGNLVTLNKGSKIVLKNVLVTDSTPIIKIIYKDKKYIINKNAYYDFNWHFSELPTHTA